MEETLLLALGVLVGNTIFHPLVRKTSWKEGLDIGVLSALIVMGAQALINAI